jgi:hypothetical protein
MRAVVRQDELEDLVAVVGQTFLGLTVNCARCHDHKFDPVTQREYYQLAAALAGVRHGEREITWPLRAVESTGENTPMAAVQERPEPRVAKVYAVCPEQPELAYVLERGNPANRGEVAAPGGVAAVSWNFRSAAANKPVQDQNRVDSLNRDEQAPQALDFALDPRASDAERRRGLADWITHIDNPLFRRVIVNRLWHYHFGIGLVDTPSDFGFNGGRPSHPELIDHLAATLIQHDWHLKPLHRLITTSATYRQASEWRERAASIDADNRLLWRKAPIRLEAESLRDTLLWISGRLNRQMGGPGYRDFTTFVQNTQFYLMQDVDGPAFNRRSIYRTWVRSGRNGLLDVFDCPDPSTRTPRRAVTVTPLQALSLMNNVFVLRSSRELAERVRHEVGDQIDQRIRRVYELAYARQPAEDELILARQFATKHGLPALCRVLLNCNELLYVD